MDKLKSVKDSLKAICLKTTGLPIQDLMKQHKFWMNQNGSFALNKKETDNFYKIANYLREKYKGGNLFNDVSEKDIESFLLKYISEVIILPNQVDKINTIENIEKDIEHRIISQVKEYEVIFPLKGLKIKRRFKFGSMFFYPFTKYQLTNEVKFVSSFLQINQVMSDKQKREFTNIWKSVLSVFLKQCTVKCSVNGTSTAAELKFYNSILLHINSLKFLIYDILNRKPSREKIKSDHIYIEGVMKTNDGVRTTTFKPIESNFNIIDLSFLKTKKARCLSTLLKKENKDEIDNRILGSINWAISAIENSPTKTDESDFYNSSIYMTPTKYLLSQSLLNTLIAFESLLIFKDERSLKKELLKYRSIALLEKTDFTNSFITEQLNKAYEIRSELIHEGNFNNSPKPIFQLYVFYRHIVFELITLKLKKSITTNYQLKNWFLMKENYIKYEENKSTFNKSV